MSKIWFVTGSSRGLGRCFVEAALGRGDRVAATARSTGSFDASSPATATRCSRWSWT
jgi:NAD(P)-dependent dehydrogenase (short-subunit alcohol dehydrogenase family)